MTYKYCVAENWGKGFIEIEEARSFRPTGFPANVWQIPANNKDANLWVYKVAGTFKTKSEAQALITAEIDAAKTAWDNNNVEGETVEQKERRLGSKPTDITLP